MNWRTHCVLVAALSLIAATSKSAAADEEAGASLRVDDLRCEYLVNPLGIDARAPRLSWKLVAVRPEATSLAQSAYQVVVAPTEALLREDKGTLWDSGKVVSDQSLHVAYAGEPLALACDLLVESAGLGSGWQGLGLEPARRNGAWACSMPATGQAQWIGLGRRGRVRRAVYRFAGGFVDLVPRGQGERRCADRHSLLPQDGQPSGRPSRAQGRTCWRPPTIRLSRLSTAVGWATDRAGRRSSSST